MNIEELRKVAWTFPDLIPPNNAKKVAQEYRDGQTYEYFMDDEGNAYYETDNDKKWKRELEEWKRQRKKALTY